jgi:hypothetical protein
MSRPVSAAIQRSSALDSSYATASATVRVGRQPTQARQRGVGHRPRREPFDRRAIGGRAGDAILTQRARELGDVERAARCRGVAGLAERRLDLLSEDRVGQDVDPGGSQRRRPHMLKALRRAQAVDQHLAGARLGRSRADDQRDGEALDAPREIHEPADRLVVAPMQVVDDQGHGALGCQIGRQPYRPCWTLEA